MTMNNKVALVTGGARGIGRAICRTLANDGFKIAINFNNSENEAIALIEKAKYRINMDVGCMIDIEWIDSLKGVKSEYVRPRNEIIDDFISYYKNFKADDEW